MDDLKQVPRWRRRQLHSYGWVDEKAGVARVPIDKAKELLLRARPARARQRRRRRNRACGTTRARVPASACERAARAAEVPRTQRRRETTGQTVTSLGKTRDGDSLLFAALLAVGGARPRAGARARSAGEPANAKPGVLEEVGIDQKIGQQLPLDLVFRTKTAAT